MNLATVRASFFLFLCLLAGSMAQDGAKPTVPTSFSNDGLDVDFEDEADPESGASARKPPTTTTAKIVPGTVPTSELAAVPTTTVPTTTVPTTTVPTTTVPTTTVPTITVPTTTFPNTHVPTTTVPTTTVPTTTDPTTTDPTTTVPTTTFPNTHVPTTTVPTITVPTTTVPTTTVPTTTVPTITVPTATDSIKALLTKTVPELSEEAKLLALIAQNTSHILLSDILATNRNITRSLEKQKESLLVIRHAEGLLLNATRNAVFRDAKLLRGFVQAFRKIDGHANHIIDDVAFVLQLQNETKNGINSLSAKIGDIQRHIQRSSKGFDQNLHRLRQIIQQSIKAKIRNLNPTAGSLNISQVNSLAELENLPIVRENSKSAVEQLTALEHQFSILNRNQKRSLDSLTKDIQKWTPTNLSSINDQLQSLIVSQKRTELDWALCDGDSSKKSADEQVMYGTIVSDGFFDTRQLDPRLTSNAASERYVQVKMSPKLSWYNVAHGQTSGRNDNI